jgi:hypothetical protein
MHGRALLSRVTGMPRVAGRRASVVALALGVVCGLAPAIQGRQSVPRFPSFPLPGEPPPAAPPARGGWDPARLEQWLDAVERHVPGEVDGPLAGAAGWAESDLRQLWVDVQVLLQVAATPSRTRFTILPMVSETRPAPGGRSGPSLRAEDRAALETLAVRLRGRGVNRTVKRAALLHTDVVTLGEGIAAPTGTLDAGAPFRMLIGDGTTIGVQGVSIHWELGRLVLSHVTPDPKRDDFVRDWYRATVAMRQSVEFFDVPHLSQALRLFPDDPELLLLAGVEREAMATPLFQAFARSFSSTSMRTGIGRAERELSAALRFYRRALDANADLREARLRLGRVLALMGRHADAVRELRLAGDGSTDPLLEYYAAFFLGAALEGAGDVAAARDALQRAADLAPASRAPHLALARIARERGDREETTVSLDRALARVANDDPLDPMCAADARRRGRARGPAAPGDRRRHGARRRVTRGDAGRRHRGWTDPGGRVQRRRRHRQLRATRPGAGHGAPRERRGVRRLEQRRAGALSRGPGLDDRRPRDRHRQGRRSRAGVPGHPAGVPPALRHHVHADRRHARRVAHARREGEAPRRARTREGRILLVGAVARPGRHFLPFAFCLLPSAFCLLPFRLQPRRQPCSLASRSSSRS